MSREPDQALDLDSILAEFHRQENAPVPAPERSSAEPRSSEPGPYAPQPREELPEPEPLPAEPQEPAPVPPAPEQELEPEPEPEAPVSAPAPPAPVAEVLTQPAPLSAPPVEGTVLYESKPLGKTALYQAQRADLAAAPARKGPGKASGKASGKSSGKTSGKASGKASGRVSAKPAPSQLGPAPQYRPRPAAPVVRKPRSRGLGFALMFLVLLFLAAALAGLLRWSSLAEKEAVVPEPEPLRLELIHSLEHLLDEQAGTSR